ncbi:urease accessory protein UreF [Iamia sp. SCSIO 61187]|uniref:urease accessory protein UreF n=1 Tax=Iamia sp. SCSIO 61187 TaxID=2722752 RepID=UPI001C62EE32|nr:urease accessory UreF family protein [Iamia sp. SCSIO 61187]QYG94030.1 urease accessory protein UreF [Iamia sp. SCSIO 61187]
MAGPVPTTAVSVLAGLVLGDGRLPVGASSHSWGVEPAVRHMGLDGADDLRSFLEARLPEAALVEATAAALAAGHEVVTPDPWWEHLVAELDARIPSAAQRATSDRLGRLLLRAAGRLWPSPGLALVADGRRTPQAAVLGAVGRAASISPVDAAALSLHGAASMAASAAVRLRGLDPVEAQAVVVGLHPLLATLAATAAGVGGPSDLPPGGTVTVDLLAEVHAHEEARLFAS